MSTLITPRTLSGFRDYLPDVMLAREQVLETARDVYRSYGFTPIDTPACESPTSCSARAATSRTSSSTASGVRKATRRRWACAST